MKGEKKRERLNPFILLDRWKINRIEDLIIKWKEKRRERRQRRMDDRMWISIKDQIVRMGGDYF